MNQKGQAMLEASIILMITMAGLILLLKKGLEIPLDFYLDDLVEKTLICEFRQNDCTASLYNRLQKFKFRNIMIQSNSSKNQKAISLTAISPFGYSVKKDATLNLKINNL